MPPRSRDFFRMGYAVLERFFGTAERSALADAIDLSLASAHGVSCERPHNTLVPLRWNDALVGLALASRERCNRVRQVVDATDLRWISGYLSLKEPHSPPLWWHQDWWCWDHSASYMARPPQVALLSYPTATDRRNGALRVLPGSHRASHPLHAVLPEAHAAASGALSPAHPALNEHPDQVTLELQPGDAVVIDYRLLHGTHANTTGARRDGVLLTFAPSWSALPPEIRAHLIRHPALPTEGDDASAVSWADGLLPRYDGRPRDLPLSRTAPRDFSIIEGAAGVAIKPGLCHDKGRRSERHAEAASRGLPGHR